MKKRMRLMAAILASMMVFSLLGCSYFKKSEDSTKKEEHSEKKDKGSEDDFSGVMTEETAGGADMLTGAAAGSKSGSGENACCPEPYPGQPQAGMLTGAVWNDHENWEFYQGLLGQGLIEYPAFGLSPVNRVKAVLVDEKDKPLPNEDVSLYDADGKKLFTARSDLSGTAYLFFKDSENPAYLKANGSKADLTFSDKKGNGTAGETVLRTKPAKGTAGGLQVMFIMDTTGSMSDELDYLTRDFASIAEEVGGQDITYSVNFYRDEDDEYITDCHKFTSDTERIASCLKEQSADGGGDRPEAVAQILTETITENDAWDDQCMKIAFLIYDAPPHEGTDQEIAEAVSSAAERGIHLIPVVSSNAERDTEFFGRAIAVETNSDYIFLTDDSGIGESHLEPIVGSYQVELLHEIIVREIESYRP